MNHRLKIPCSTDKLKDVRAFLDQTLIEYAIEEEERNLLILAVDEICANVIIHSQSGDQQKELEVKVAKNEEGLLFEIIDTGQPFDYTTIAEPDIQTIVKEKRKGGLGLMLVRRIMDSIELKKENSLTIYRLFKRVSPC